MKHLLDMEPLYDEEVKVGWEELNTKWPSQDERNRIARNYSYEKRDENAARWNRITCKALVVAAVVFAVSLLVWWVV